MVPHRYPFRWIDTRSDDRARLRLTQVGSARDAAALPSTLVLEILAQGALALLAGGGETPKEAILAAIDDARLPSPDQPLRPGDTLEVEVRSRRGLGSLLRLETVLWRDDEVVASARLTVAQGKAE